jgi:hypothetical protein
MVASCCRAAALSALRAASAALAAALRAFSSAFCCALAALSACLACCASLGALRARFLGRACAWRVARE